MNIPQYRPGRYLGRVVKQKLGEASTGNPMFVLTFDVLGLIDPAHPDDDLISVAAGERSIFRVITDKTTEYLIADLKALGFTGQRPSQLDPDSSEHQSFVNQEINVTCSHETYDGKMRERWQLDRGGLEIKALEPQSMRKLDAIFGRNFKDAFGAGPAPKQEIVTGTQWEQDNAKDKQPVPTADHGDIPF